MPTQILILQNAYTTLEQRRKVLKKGMRKYQILQNRYDYLQTVGTYYTPRYSLMERWLMLSCEVKGLEYAMKVLDPSATI